MRLIDIKIDNNKTVFSFELKDEKYSFFIQSSLEYCKNKIADAFLYIMFLAALKNREDIDLGEYSIQSETKENVEKLIDLFCEWFPNHFSKKINIKCQTTNTESNVNSKKIYSFFTGGLDSLFTLNTNSEITDSVYVHGFDIKAEDSKLFNLAIKNIEKLTLAHEKKLIIFETDLRVITERFVWWEYIHGMILIGFSRLVPDAKKVVIPSSFDISSQITKYGSHHEFDKYFMSSFPSIEHDGYEYNRLEKINAIKDRNKDLNLLRVCWKNVGNRLNCGVCEKCLRTKIELDINKCLDSNEAFQNKEIYALLENFTMVNNVTFSYYSEMFEKTKDKNYHTLLKQKINEYKNMSDEKKEELNTFTGKNKNILFVDFNGVVSFNPFWNSIKNIDHIHNEYFTKIEEMIFRGDKELVIGWMTGIITTEEIHVKIKEHYNIPEDVINDIMNQFINDCKSLDIDSDVINILKDLKKYYRLILVTDNMDTFSRFTLPSNQVLSDVFEVIHDSYIRKSLKKSNSGEVFTGSCKEYNVPIEYSILIDDSSNNCKAFSDLGGRTLTPKTKEQVIDMLSELLKETKDKWEWQY